MKGSVRKRGATWSYYFDLGKVDGKRKRKEKKGFRTKKEAEPAAFSSVRMMDDRLHILAITALK